VSDAPRFDSYAEAYDDALQQGLSVSGEGREFFARERVELLRARLARVGAQPRRVLDFGCGTGDTAPLLDAALTPERIIGVDTSERSIALARRRFGSERVEFSPFGRFTPAGDQDLVYCSGVFHHVPPEERPGVVDFIARALRPGGFLALWENNPWNPGARYVMHRIPFDRDAVMLSHRETVRILRAGGFDVAEVDFLFIFPRVLAFLRPIERAVTRLPLGAQYQVLCRKK
jgi:SAM-dependent methyltransferase